MNKKLKIGILGVGHLGKIHLKCIQAASDIFELVGFFDPEDNNAKHVAQSFGVKRFDNLENLISVVDIVDIVTPTLTHFELAQKAIIHRKHIFIEKPVTHTLEEAKSLIKLKKEKGVKIQVGHVERFNPALLALQDKVIQPMFIEAHRLAQFNPRGTDVSVVLDLMIHDLDIILSLVQSKVIRILANGVAVVSTSPDIANARIEFANGCVANLTASRISLKQMRKVRLFQKDAYISLDFLEKQAQVIRLFDEGSVSAVLENTLELETPSGPKLLHIDTPKIEPVNAIKMELETFARSILQNEEPTVSIEDGYQALKLAYQIIQEIEKNSLEKTSI